MEWILILDLCLSDNCRLVFLQIILSISKHHGLPPDFVKEPNSSELWYEVVRKGKKRVNPKGRNNKKHDNDMCILEY